MSNDLHLEYAEDGLSNSGCKLFSFTFFPKEYIDELMIIFNVATLWLMHTRAYLIALPIWEFHLLRTLYRGCAKLQTLTATVTQFVTRWYLTWPWDIMDAKRCFVQVAATSEKPLRVWPTWKLHISSPPSSILALSCFRFSYGFPFSSCCWSPRKWRSTPPVTFSFLSPIFSPLVLKRGYSDSQKKRN